MPRTRQAKVAFTSGEIDDLLDSRVDLAIYQNGARRIRNALCIPQGGVIRSPGLRYHATFPNLGGGGIPQAKFIDFVFSTVQSYLIVVTEADLRVYKDGVLQTTDPSPYTDAEVPFVTWTQNLDTLLLFHEDVPTQQYVRQGADTIWTLSAWDYDNIPTYIFDIPIPTGVGSIAGATGTGINFSSSVAEFLVGDVGRYIRATAGGVAIITAFVNSTNVTVDIFPDSPFNIVSPQGMPAGEWFLEELVISVARGYPKSGAFNQGRLILAGLKSRPDTIIGSRSQAPHDLNSRVADQDNPDFGFMITAESRTVVNFVNINSGQHVQILADSGEWYIPVSETTPLTPTNVLLRETSRRGSKIGSHFVVADDGPIFVEQSSNGTEGINIREMLFVGDIRRAYEAENISLLSGSLIRDPVSIAIQKGGTVDEADYVFVVNADGTCAVYCTLRGQEINAWSLRSTDGLFKAVASEQDIVYFAVNRTIDAAEVLYLERFDLNLLLDSALFGVGAATQATVLHLIGETVAIFIDGVFQGTKIVPPGGIVVFDTPAVVSWQVGLQFPDVDPVNPIGDRVLIETLSADIVLPEGVPIGKKKRTPNIVARVQETSGLYINGTSIPTRKFGLNLLDQAPPSFTGDLEKRGNLGWTPNGRVRFSQREPATLTLKAAAYDISVG